MRRSFLGLLFLISATILPAEDLRIVSLAPALTETICFLGGEKYLVGRCSACDYPASVKNLPAAGRFGIVELERVIALKPNWVISNDLMNVQAAEKMRELGIKVDLAQIDSMDDYVFWLKLIGEKLNKLPQVRQILKEQEEKKLRIEASPPLPVKVLWVVNSKPLIVAGPGSLPDSTLKIMRLENAAAAAPVTYFKPSVEWVLSNRIDLIIWGVPGKVVDSGRFWNHLPAVKKQRIVYHDIYDPVTRPGPRYLDAVEKLRRKVELIQEKRL